MCFASWREGELVQRRTPPALNDIDLLRPRGKNPRPASTRIFFCFCCFAFDWEARIDPRYWFFYFLLYWFLIERRGLNPDLFFYFLLYWFLIERRGLNPDYFPSCCIVFSLVAAIELQQENILKIPTL